MNLTDPHLYRPDRTLLWAAIAAKVAANHAVLEWPLANITRWLAYGRLHPAPLLEWRALIEQAQGSPQGMAALQVLFEAGEEDAHASRLKSCSPFPGLLTPQELALCYSPSA